MQRFAILIVLLCCALALAGFKARFQARVGSDTNPAGSISQTLERFVAEEKPEREVPLSRLSESRATAELRDPKKALPATHHYPYAEISRLWKYAERCERSLVPTSREPGLRKPWLWHSFLCGHATNLPENFFKSAPFMHPTGKSFVQLARSSGHDEFKTTGWIQRTEAGRHLLELPELQGVTPQKLSQLQDEAPWVAARQGEIWIRKRTGETSVHYLVFPQERWEAYARTQDYIPATTGCPIRFEDSCWAENPAASSRTLRWVATLALGLATILAIALALVLIRRNFARKRELERRTFMLQMLAHELRTPATGLKLSLEALRSDFDRLPESSQKAFLQMCDQAQRLGRVTEASRQYLGTSPTSGKISVQPREIGSINEFVSQVIAEAAGGAPVSLALLGKDRPGWLDPYWTEVCLSNLVRNAIQHGVPPVSVSIEESRGGLVIRVQDRGSLPTDRLEDLSSGTIPSPKRGMGLGLSMIQALVEAMQGRLELSPNPTTFTLELPEKRK